MEPRCLQIGMPGTLSVLTIGAQTSLSVEDANTQQLLYLNVHYIGSFAFNYRYCLTGAQVRAVILL